MGSSDRTERWTSWLAEHTGRVLWIVVGVTALLVVPFLALQPDESASQEPSGEVFAARDKIEDDFASSVFVTFVIIEDQGGDMLRAEPLRALLAAEDALRADPEIGPSLFTYFDADEVTDVVGISSIADQIDARLPGGLASATDLEVKQVAAQLIDGAGLAELGLSAQTTTGSDGLPVSPALLEPVVSDDTILGFGGAGVRLGTDTEPEEYSRDVVDLLRGDSGVFEVWGVAIDVNLTSAEQGALAGPFIGFTILAVLLIVGLTYRSYWILAATGAALAALVIWLQGITNLLGFEDDLVLSLIVPIAMISFGVDFTFHAVGRYREGRHEGHAPRMAFVTGLAAVSGALVLALASDSAAFLSNVSAGIESVIQFGIGASVALGAAFLLLGVVTPLVVMKIDEKTAGARPGRGRRALAANGAGLAAAFVMASVLLSVFIYPAAGAIALAVYVLAFLVVPYRMATPGDGSAAAEAVGRPNLFIGRAVTAVTRARWVVLPVVAVITVVAVSLMIRVESEFDVKDFFAADTDFVVSLDKLDEHGGEQTGEPADILIDADLTDPVALAAVSDFVSDLGDLETDRFGRGDDGKVYVLGGVLDVIEEVWDSPVGVPALQQLAGVTLTDDDGDGLPDTSEQLTALYALTRTIGVPYDLENLVLTPDNVRNVLSASSATRVQLFIAGTRGGNAVTAAQQELDPHIAALESRLREVQPDAQVTLTGGPITRQKSLDTILRALQISLPIAVVLCLVIAWWFMRSFRFAVVSIIPILIVVSWLYGFMYLAGYAINLVTATIGAVSIGIGIDFAIHFTMRYREELGRLGSRVAAVRASGEGTGGALFASAVSSIVGFAILAMAPMPLFAAYGFLTAVMIAMALVASLLVLPSLLVLVTRDSAPPSAAR